jgi:hypothetical protein
LVVISYDIACQYAINFWHRMSQMPVTMQITIPEENVWWKIPNFHLPVHKPPCHTPYSFHWMWGAGMTHGEGVEQNWVFSNGVVGSMRLMGPGSWSATLEDIFGFHNYDQQLAMRKSFFSHAVLRVLMSDVRSRASKAPRDQYQGGAEAPGRL